MEQGSSVSPISRIGFIGNYLPRQCGIATFTTDLCEAVAAEFPGATCIALPVNDIAAGYDYPSRVRFELSEKDIDSYRRAADFLNINNVDLVCLQHEYGIYGGRAGSHILALLRDLRMPIVTPREVSFRRLPFGFAVEVRRYRRAGGDRLANGCECPRIELDFGGHTRIRFW